MKSLLGLAACLLFASALTGACLADVAGAGVMVTAGVLLVVVCVAIVAVAVGFIVKAIMGRRRK